MIRLQKKIIPPLYVLQVFGFFFLAFYLSSIPLLNEDSAWHIAAGDYIRSVQSIPLKNIWSFSAPNQTWYNLAWGWDVLSSFLLEVTGQKGFFIFLCIWHGVIASIVALHLKQRKPHPAAFYAIMSLLLFVCMSYQWSRPQTFSLMMVALFHYGLHLSRSNASSKAMLIGLPFLMVLWANAHGGFIAAFFIYAAYGIEAMVSRNQAWLKTLFVSGTLCLVATLVNPYSWEIWLSIYENYTSAITPHIEEWMPYAPLSIPAADIFLFLVLVATDLRDRNVPLADKISYVFWIFMFMLSRRHLFVAVLLSLPVLAAGLKKWIDKGVATPVLKTDRSLKAVVTTGIIVVLLTVIPFHKIVGRDLMLGRTVVPTDAFAFIREHYPHKNFMNQYDWGGYIIFFNKGLSPVFSDNRTRTAYPETIMQETVEILSGNYQTFLSAIETYHAEGVIIDSQSPFVAKHPIPSTWNRVYKDNFASVYVIERK